MEFLTRHKSIVTLISFSLFCIISLSVQGGGVTLTFEGIMSAIVTPFSRGYNAIANGIGSLFSGFESTDSLKEDLLKARSQLQKYESMQIDMIQAELAETRAENDKLRNILGFREKIKYDSIAAQVISKDPDNWFRTLVINKGENDGVAVNMPVIAYQNGQRVVVGKIVEVRGSISRVQPIIAPDIKVGVKLFDSKIPGLLSGYSYNSDYCVVNYISRATQTKKGDIIVTSGQAGVFPPELLIGTVERSELSESNPYQKIIVKPYVEYSLLEEVFILLKKPDKDFFDMFEEVK